MVKIRKEERKGKINDGMKNITLAWFFPRWFQHDLHGFK